MTLQELIHKYPKIFKKTEYSIGWSVSDTWIPLIDEMCVELQSYLIANDMQHLVYCVQMKEKFGDLRFYLNTTNDDLEHIINVYTNKLNNICENCGSTENVELDIRQWYSYKCEKCRSTT